MTTQTVTHTFEVELEDDDGNIYTCNVDAHSKCYYHPGRLSGPPEDCYPAESDQETTFEIIDCYRDGERLFPGPVLLTKLESLLPVAWMEEKLWEQFMSGDSEP